MITKKHYNKLASLIEAHLNDCNKDKFITELANYLEQDNPNFNRGMFVHACYWTKEKFKKSLEVKTKNETVFINADNSLTVKEVA